MNSRLVDYIDEGNALNADERELAALALQRVDPAEQAEVAVAWNAEIDRRLNEITQGEVQAVSGPETRAMGRTLLAQLRNARLD